MTWLTISVAFNIFNGKLSDPSRIVFEVIAILLLPLIPVAIHYFWYTWSTSVTFNKAKENGKEIENPVAKVKKKAKKTVFKAGGKLADLMSEKNSK